MTRIFISHSHSDKDIAEKLVDFLLASLEINDDEIRCTSVPGHQLPFGTSIDEQLKQDLNNTTGLIALITKDSLLSTWVLFELGASWAMNKLVVPIIGPGLTYENLPASLKNYPGVLINDEHCSYRLTDAVNQLARTLSIAHKNNSKKDYKKEQFINQLKEWKSNRPYPELSLLQQIEELTAKLKEYQELNQTQSATNEQEKQHLKTEIENLNRSLKEESQKTQNQLEQKQVIISQQSENIQILQQQLAEKDSIIAQLQQQLSQPTVEVELKSKKGVDYSRLRDLLAAGEWKQADQETARVMCQAANRESEEWLREEDIDKLPCEDLRTINQLWLHYSKGKFGFSVQAEIYRSLGGTKKYDKVIWEKFGDSVGWRKGGSWLNYFDLTFNIDALKAHLPFFWGNLFWGGRRDYLFSRVKTCNL